MTPVPCGTPLSASSEVRFKYRGVMIICQLLNILDQKRKMIMYKILFNLRQKNCIMVLRFSLSIRNIY